MAGPPIIAVKRAGIAIGLAATTLVAVAFMGEWLARLRVPANLFVGVRVTGIGSDRITAEGTWVSSAPQPDRISTSKVVCERAIATCTMTTARLVSGSFSEDWFLRLEDETHQIFEWKGSIVTYGSRYPCGSEIYALDVKTETGVGRKTRVAERPGCDHFPADESLRLSDGAALIQEMRTKARPALIRAITGDWK